MMKMKDKVNKFLVMMINFSKKIFSKFTSIFSNHSNLGFNSDIDWRIDEDFWYYESPEEHPEYEEEE